MIAIVDCCGNNFASIDYALQRLGAKTVLTSDAKVLAAASHVILPGVGQASHAMANLRRAGLIAIIKQLEQPVLGICLGMQLLYEYSEEGCTPCLGVIAGKVERFALDASLIVPHMGWNQLNLRQVGHPLVNAIDDGSFVYFVHSFLAIPSAVTLAETFHGCYFSAMVQQKNFFGMQFHPEKSGSVGEKILENFLTLY
ncbi:MAG: imidazole glycerol phosphate synthase subunit HisH [Gammaproteobacteria bacterium]|nr:imidazole glycerol phosphate synthase subunit HisH [Gammaproteobacteria bacterium]